MGIIRHNSAKMKSILKEKIENFRHETDYENCAESRGVAFYALVELQLIICMNALA